LFYSLLYILLFLNQGVDSPSPPPKVKNENEKKSKAKAMDQQEDENDSNPARRQNPRRAARDQAKKPTDTSKSKEKATTSAPPKKPETTSKGKEKAAPKGKEKTAAQVAPTKPVNISKGKEKAAEKGKGAEVDAGPTTSSSLVPPPVSVAPPVPSRDQDDDVDMGNDDHLPSTPERLNISQTLPFGGHKQTFSLREEDEDAEQETNSYKPIHWERSPDNKHEFLQMLKAVAYHGGRVDDNMDESSHQQRGQVDDDMDESSHQQGGQDDDNMDDVPLYSPTENNDDIPDEEEDEIAANLNPTGHSESSDGVGADDNDDDMHQVGISFSNEKSLQTFKIIIYYYG
jgi:hypothetical protein